MLKKNMMNIISITNHPPQLIKIIAVRAYNQRKALGMNNAGEQDNCLIGDSPIYETNYSVSVGEKGLVFSTHFPHVAQACGEEVEIAYLDLLPFLNIEGKKHVKELINETFARSNFNIKN